MPQSATVFARLAGNAVARRAHNIALKLVWCAWWATLPAVADERPARLFWRESTSVSSPRPAFPLTVLSFPVHAQEYGMRRVPRQFRLKNGDTLTGEILSGSAEAFDVRWFDQMRVRLQTASLESLRIRTGERVLLEEGFSESAPSEWLSRQLAAQTPGGLVRDGALLLPAADGPRTVTIPAAAGSFRCTLRIKIPPIDANSGGKDATVGFHFSDDATLEAVRGTNNRWLSAWRAGTAARQFRQPTASSPTWHHFRLQRVADRLTLSIDGQLNFAANDCTAEFVGITVSGLELGKHWEFDDLSLASLNQAENPIPESLPDLDAVVGRDGETWWGEFQETDAHHVRWLGKETVWTNNWRDTQAIVFRQQVETAAGRQLTGRIVRIELQASSDRPDVPGDRLTGALRESRAGWLMVEHPLCGLLSVPQTAVRTVRYHFLGTWLPLQTQCVVWKDSTGRADRPELRGEFRWVPTPRAAIFLSAEMSGLEPAGANTPPGSTTLKSLRRGIGATHLEVNEHSVGRFNDFLHHWTLPGEFERLRIPVPVEFLHRGENAWRIVRGEPGTAPPLRIQNVALEIEPATVDRFP